MTAKVSAAFVKAQAEIEKAAKDKTNPHFRSKYADLGAVVDAIKPALEAHGLAFLQKFHHDERGISVETIVIHESGETLSNGVLNVPASKMDAQGFGSACTYARRYSLQAAFGVAPEDDDGNAASKKPETKPELKQEPVPKDVIINSFIEAESLEILDKRYSKAKTVAVRADMKSIQQAYDERKAALTPEQEPA